MVSPYSWHPGSSVESPKWVGARKLLPDEIFSSWLIRSAFALSCAPLELTRLLWPKSRVWTQDVDRGVSIERLKSLSILSGVKNSHIELSTTTYYSKIISDGSINDRFAHPWVMSLGTRNLNRSGGLQLCAECFKEDRTPYIRIFWRFSWHAVCDKHGCLLLDRCSFCKSPIQPHKLKMGSSSLSVCSCCLRDIRSWNAPFDVEYDSFYQRLADDVLHNLTGKMFGINVSCSEWFESSKYLFSLLRSIDRTEKSPLRNALNDLGICLPQTKVFLSPLSLEKLDPLTRSIAFEFLGQLQKTDLSELQHALQINNVGQKSLCVLGSDQPRLIKTLGEHLVNRKRKSRQPRKSVDAPVPKHEVERRMKALERKYNHLIKKGLNASND